MQGRGTGFGFAAVAVVLMAGCSPSIEPVTQSQDTGGSSSAPGGASGTGGGATPSGGSAAATTGGSTSDGGNPPAETGGTAPTSSGGSPPTESGGTAPTSSGGSPPAETGGTAPTSSGGSPPAETGGTAPTSSGGSSSSTGGVASTGFSPLCSTLVTAAGPAPTKGGPCVAADPQLCYKTCGPNSIGFKTETCNGTSYAEGSTCQFDQTQDYSCYKLPDTAPAECPTTAPQATMACTVATCTVCGGTAAAQTTGYLDSGGAAKAGFCVCTAGGKWTCATSGTAWPCPGSPGC